jgi:hypothetical protein
VTNETKLVEPPTEHLQAYVRALLTVSKATGASLTDVIAAADSLGCIVCDEWGTNGFGKYMRSLCGMPQLDEHDDPVARWHSPHTDVLEALIRHRRNRNSNDD